MKYGNTRKKGWTMMDRNFIQRLEECVVERVGRIGVWRVARLVVGLTPLLASLFFVVHVGLLLCGREYEIAYLVCSYSFTGFVAWIIVSLAFQFNWMHRAFISYNYLVSFCVDFEREVGFGRWLDSARWMVLGIGVCLLCDFVRVRGWRSINRIDRI